MTSITREDKLLAT